MGPKALLACVLACVVVAAHAGKSDCKSKCKARGQTYSYVKKTKSCTCYGVYVDEEWSCYPASARVHTPLGTKAVEDVRIGDRVLVRTNGGDDAFREVYAFSSRRPLINALFFRLETSNQTSVLLSPDHLVRTSRGLLATRMVHAGDEVRVQGGMATVASVGMESARGLFNIHARDSDGVYVDGVLVSELTEVSRPLAYLPAQLREILIATLAKPVGYAAHAHRDSFE